MNLRFKEKKDGLQRIIFGVKQIVVKKICDIFVVLIVYDENNKEVEEVVYKSKSEKEVNNFINTLWSCELNQNSYFDYTQEQNK